VALIETSRSARDSLRQVLALDEFHHQGIGALRFLKSVDDLNGFVHRQGTDLLAQSLAVSRFCFACSVMRSKGASP